VNVPQVVTVDKIDLEERIGRLPGAALSSVLTGLRSFSRAISGHGNSSHQGTEFADFDEA
jgi:hypothetical protein